MDAVLSFLLLFLFLLLDSVAGWDIHTGTWELRGGKRGGGWDSRDGNLLLVGGREYHILFDIIPILTLKGLFFLFHFFSYSYIHIHLSTSLAEDTISFVYI
jgi:hypothetical protein